MPSSSSTSSSVIPVELNNGGTVTTRSLDFRGKTYLLRQEPSSRNHGLVVWDAAIALLDYISTNPKVMNNLQRKRILELGAGTGIVGIVLQDFTQGNIIVTDLPSVVPNLLANVAANAHSIPKDSSSSSSSSVVGSSSSGTTDSSSIKVLPYCWGDNYDDLLKDGPIDCIVATDVTYSASLNPLLLRTTAQIAYASDTLRKAIQNSKSRKVQNDDDHTHNNNHNNYDSGNVPEKKSVSPEEAVVPVNDSLSNQVPEESSYTDDTTTTTTNTICSSTNHGSTGSSCTIYFANEVRDEIAQQVFDTEAEKYFQVTRIPSRSLPSEWKKNSTMRLFKMKLKRHQKMDNL